MDQSLSSGSRLPLADTGARTRRRQFWTGAACGASLCRTARCLDDRRPVCESAGGLRLPDQAPPTRGTSLSPFLTALSTFGTGEVFWSMLWFFCFFIWITLLIRVFSDIFRSHDMSGGVKALWIVFAIVLPYLGVLFYLIARGKEMSQHSIDDARAMESSQRQYIQSVAGTAGGPADEIARLADLRDKGVIDEAEFQAGKAKALAG